MLDERTGRFQPSNISQLEARFTRINHEEHRCYFSPFAFLSKEILPVRTDESEVLLQIKPALSGWSFTCFEQYSRSVNVSYSVCNVNTNEKNVTDTPSMIIIHGLFGSKKNFDSLAKAFSKNTGLQVTWSPIVCNSRCWWFDFLLSKLIVHFHAIFFSFSQLFWATFLNLLTC